MNPLDQAGGLVFSEANLKVTAATGWDGSRATFSYPSTGKYYWEATCISRATGAAVGILGTSAVIVGDVANAATGYVYNSGDGQKYNNGSASAYGATWGANDIIGIAWDADAGSLSFYKNGTSQGTAFTGLSGTFSPAIGVNGSDSMAANFGQRPFSYTPPAGFVSLCTTNLPNPTILQGDDYFNILLWTGNATNPRTISGLGFEPDMTWYKSRSGAGAPAIYDDVRGYGAGKMLCTNQASAEGVDDPYTDTDYGFLTQNSDGIVLNSGNVSGTWVNNNTTTYVGWNWKASGTSVSNTAGSITSTVSANTTAGFSVVTFSTNASSGGATIGHGLGVAPSMILMKARNQTYSWDVYHVSLGANYRMILNSSAAISASSSDYWNSTTPTSSVFSINQGFYGTGVNTVAYCFSEVAGYSSFGSYTGNGGSDGPFVYTGFKPRFIMVKGYSSAGNAWEMIDTARSPYNAVNALLRANSSGAEQTSGPYPDILSNGFKARSANGYFNDSGVSYIYMAFAENPFKNALAR
jgi:hypothetical protein